MMWSLPPPPDRLGGGQLHPLAPPLVTPLCSVAQLNSHELHTHERGNKLWDGDELHTLFDSVSLTDQSIRFRFRARLVNAGDA